MINKLRPILAAVFEVEEATITVDASPDSIPTWDSLKHMHLITALEEEFGIQFSEAQIGEMLNVKLIIEVLGECGIATN